MPKDSKLEKEWSHQKISHTADKLKGTRYGLQLNTTSFTPTNILQQYRDTTLFSQEPEDSTAKMYDPFKEIIPSWGNENLDDLPQLF